MQFIDGKGNYYTDNNYPKWYNTNGTEITYDTACTDWMIMAIYLDETYYPANGAETWIHGSIMDFWSLNKLGYKTKCMEIEW